MLNDNFSAEEAVAVARLEDGIDLGTVIPVVGAGVSRQGADLPCWSSLLTEALDWTIRNREELGLTDKRLERLDSLDGREPTLDCYDTWVNAVFCHNAEDRHWRDPGYRHWLEETFGVPEARDKRIYRALASMDPRVVITTNYDRLLKKELMSDGDVVTWKHKEAIRALFRERKGILHLHGTFDEPESVILTQGDYERVTTEETRSWVSRLITSHGILLFVGISPEGATDRHLHHLLSLGLPDSDSDAPRQPRTHVLLHRGEIPSRAASRLKSMDIEPVRFGDEHSDLAPFLERLGRRRSEYRTAAALVGLDRNYLGESLNESRWAPQECLGRVESSLSFMGLRSSKWVWEPGAFKAMDRVLSILDTHEKDCVRFLILNPRSDAYKRLEWMRGVTLSSEHLQKMVELEQKHPSLCIRCVDFISAFRFTAVNDKEVGLALYPTSPAEFEESNGGWTARHHSLHTEQRWSLARSLLFMFDEHFRSAEPLQDANPELFS